MKRRIIVAVAAALLALPCLAMAGGPPPQAGTVLPGSQAGPLVM